MATSLHFFLVTAGAFTGSTTLGETQVITFPSLGEPVIAPRVRIVAHFHDLVSLTLPEVGIGQPFTLSFTDTITVSGDGAMGAGFATNEYSDFWKFDYLLWEPIRTVVFLADVNSSALLKKGDKHFYVHSASAATYTGEYSLYLSGTTVEIEAQLEWLGLEK